jgi:hypothetical protein
MNPTVILRAFLLGLALTVVGVTRGQSQAVGDRSYARPGPSSLFLGSARQENAVLANSGHSSLQSEGSKTWAIEGLIVGTAIGVVTCATDDTNGESCRWKIPAAAIVGYAMGRWLTTRK